MAVALLADAGPLAAVEPSAAAVGWDLPRAWAEVQRRHPQLRAAAADVDAAHARIAQARSAQLPTLALDASHAQTTANFAPRPGAVPRSFNATASQWSGEPFAFWQATLGSRWNAIDFGRTAAVAAAASHGEAGAAATARNIRRQLWLQLALAYVQVQAAEAALDAARQSRDQARQRRELVKLRVDAQVRPQLDLLRADSDLAAAEVTVLRGEDQVRVLRQVLGTTLGEPLAVQGPLAAAELGDAELAPDPTGDAAQLARWCDQALHQRDDLMALDARILATRASLDATAKAARPALFLSAQLSAAGIEVSNLVVNAQVAGGVSWPVSGLWLQDAQAAELRANLQSLLAQREAMVLAVRDDVALQVAALSQVRRRQPAIQSLLRYTTEAHEHAKARYAAGVAALFEVVDAEAALTQARLQHVQAQLDEATALGRWRAVMGRIPP